MDKAKNIIEFAKNLFFDRPVLKDEKQYYVPIFNDNLEIIRDRIINEDLENYTLYIAGQSGSGKTTAMNFMPDEEINSKFKTLYINYRDLLAFDDADIIDVLLMFGFKLGETNDKIKERFEKKLQDYYKIHIGALEKSKENTSKSIREVSNETEGGIGLKFLNLISLGTKFLLTFKAEKEFRNFSREIFKLHKTNLLELINEMITQWYEINGSAKKLLIIFDDFDKLRQQEQINSIFIENRYFLESIKAKKIFSVPINLAGDSAFATPSTLVIFFHLKLFHNPINKKSKDGEDRGEEKLIDENRGRLIELIYQRGEEELIEKEAIKKAIEYSGGILRLFVQLVSDASAYVRRLKGSKVSVNDIEYAINEKRSQLSFTIMEEDTINLLNKIMDDHIPVSIKDKEGLFVKTLLDLQTIAFNNGMYWYDVNPILKDVITKYKRK